jgi:LuxR family maltose regulon positive regulatory protein
MQSATAELDLEPSAPVRRLRLLRPRPAPDAVARPRLVARLRRGLECALVLLSAPAGAGKTTLLCQWLATTLAAPGPRAPAASWLSLDERVGDAPAFAAHLVAALRTAVPGAGRQTLGLLRLARRAPPAALGETLAEDLLGLPRDVVLVLDDYHALRGRDAHRLLGVLLEHPPPRLHLVLATRHDPPLPLARLRARGALLELRGADLRFTADEARGFLGRAGWADVRPAPAGGGGPEPGEREGPGGREAVEAVLARTEGWAAGLRLATLASPGAPRPGDGRGGAAGEPAGGGAPGVGLAPARLFLLDEVLARQPAALQDFLLRTAVPERLCAPLGAALLGPLGGDRDADAGAGGALLDEALRRNLFLVPLEGDAGALGPDEPAAAGAGGGPGAAPDGARDAAGGLDWYRYHHLFRDALLRRLQARAGEAAVAALHARASAWFAGRGLVEEAVRHALAAGDPAGAAALVEAHAPAAVDREAWPLAEQWLALVPEAEVRRRPALLVAQAWLATIRGHYGAVPPLHAAAEALLDAAERGGPGARRDAGSDAIGGAAIEIVALRGELDAQAAILHVVVREDPPAAVGAVGRALRRLPPHRVFPRSAAVNSLGRAVQRAEGSAAAAERLRAVLAAGGAGDVVGLRVLQQLALVHYRAGALDAAVAALDEALAHPAARARAGGDLVVHAVHRVAGLVAYERDDLAAAEAHFRAVLDLPERTTLASVLEATAGLALTYQAQGRPDEARALAEGLVALLVRSGNAGHLPTARALGARLAAQRGDAAAARAWLRAAPADERLGWAALTGDRTLTRARVLLALGTPEGVAEARTLLLALRESATAQHQTAAEIQVLALLALGAAAAGDAAGAADALEAALALGAPGGFVRTFVDAAAPPGRAAAPPGRRWSPLVVLLQEAVLRRPDDPYRRRLLAAAGAIPPGAGLARPARPPAPAPVERLSRRELQVLDCLARRLSNKEIAQELVISPATVKRHVSNVCGKLGAAGRREAVRQAWALGLLAPPLAREPTLA